MTRDTPVAGGKDATKCTSPRDLQALVRELPVVYQKEPGLPAACPLREKGRREMRTLDWGHKTEWKPIKTHLWKLHRGLRALHMPKLDWVKAQVELLDRRKSVRCLQKPVRPSGFPLGLWYEAGNTQTWKFDEHRTATCVLKSIPNCSVRARIWTVVGVVCDILDALLHPASLPVQLAFPEIQVIQLGLEIDQLICNFSGVTAWSYTPETSKTCIWLHVRCLVKTFPVIPVDATQILHANALLLPFFHGFMLRCSTSAMKRRLFCCEPESFHLESGFENERTQ